MELMGAQEKIQGILNTLSPNLIENLNLKIKKTEYRLGHKPEIFRVDIAIHDL